MTEPGNDVNGQQTILRPAEVARQLGVSTATLRRWSRHFAPFLGPESQSNSGRHRRYTTDDVATLRQVKGLLDKGWTYEQVAVQLRQELARQPRNPDNNGQPASTTTAGSAPDDEAAEPARPDTSREVVKAEAEQARGEERLSVEPLSPAAQFLREALQPLSETQQLILNAQQATRDLVGVMIQDNLNLKDENKSLRERMLELERELAELKRRHADYRERMETRVRILEDAVATLMAQQQAPRNPQPPPPPSEERRGFWARLIGG